MSHTTDAKNYDLAIDAWAKTKGRAQLDKLIDAAATARASAPNDNEWDFYNLQLSKAQKLRKVKS